ncbi:MAG: alpha/beta fold hydrolase [Pseudomonadota bacterium]
MSWRAHDSATSDLIASSSEPGEHLHLRAHGDNPARPPVLFVHGATYASRLFDVPHPGASWLAATVEAGFAAYALDIRGYGRSRRDLSAATAPFARAPDAVRDIGDAVAWILDRHGTGRLRLVGGSWGSITAAMFATMAPDRVAALVLSAPIYAERNPGWLSFLADPAAPERFNPAFGAARLVSEAATRARWDAEIPDGADWREEPVLQALVQASLADDPAAAGRCPPAFEAPNGTLHDLWQAFNGQPLYDPAQIRCPTLLIRGSADPTSTRSDALELFDRLGAATRHYVEIANGAHFLSAERNAPQLFAATTAFLQANGGG